MGYGSGKGEETLLHLKHVFLAWRVVPPLGGDLAMPPGEGVIGAGGGGMLPPSDWTVVPVHHPTTDHGHDKRGAESVELFPLATGWREDGVWAQAHAGTP